MVDFEVVEFSVLVLALAVLRLFPVWMFADEARASSLDRLVDRYVRRLLV
jgi:hypothetical protein